MVPHIKVEGRVAGTGRAATEQTFVVTAVPDEKKGRAPWWCCIPWMEPRLEECLEKLGKSDLPALWRPRKDQFVRIENLPYLGTGKLDLRQSNAGH